MPRHRLHKRGLRKLQGWGRSMRGRSPACNAPHAAPQPHRLRPMSPWYPPSSQPARPGKLVFSLFLLSFLCIFVFWSLIHNNKYLLNTEMRHDDLYPIQYFLVYSVARSLLNEYTYVCLFYFDNRPSNKGCTNYSTIQITTFNYSTNLIVP